MFWTLGTKPDRWGLGRPDYLQSGWRRVQFKPSAIESLEVRRLLAAPELILDINTHTSNGSNPGHFALYQDEVYFVATDLEYGSELWKTNPRGLGATLVADLVEGSEGSSPGGLTALGDTLFFAATTGNNRRELWQINSSTTEPVRVLTEVDDGRTAPLSNPSRLYVRLDLLFFESAVVGEAQQIWRSDGTVAGTNALTQLGRNRVDVITSLDPFADFDGRTYFSVSHDGSSQLWATDGTARGTHRIRELGLSHRDTIEDLTPVGDRLFFRHGRGIWVTDGSSDGTVLLRDFDYANPPFRLTEFKGLLYFVADNSLWRSDGTADGTELVRSGVADIVGTLDGLLLFQTEPSWRQYKLWATDGTDDRVSMRSIPQRGDVNTDGIVTASDIDVIFAAINDSYEFRGLGGPFQFKDRSALYDLNLDQSIDQRDVNFLVGDILQTRPGDLDLDGDVDFVDFLQLSAHFGAAETSWETGDMDGDGRTAFADFLALASALATPLG